MNFSRNATLWLLIAATRLLAAECIPFSDASKHVGTSKCVSGKVLKITRLDSGTTFLNFCEDYRTCPFQVVIFRGDLRHVGDVRQLEGSTIEIEGDIKEYDRHAEIILKESGQLRGAAAHIPPMPKVSMSRTKGTSAPDRLKDPRRPKLLRNQNKQLRSKWKIQRRPRV